MQVQQWGWGNGQHTGTLFGQGFLPGLVGSELGGTAAGFVIVPMDLGLEEEIGGRIIGDFLIGQKGDQPFLEDLEAAFNFAFGLGIGGDPVVDAHGGEGPLELGMGVQPVCWGVVTEEGKAIGVKTGGKAELFEQAAQM